MEMLLEWDRNLSLAINQFHFNWLDPVMVFWSQKWVWLPLYALILAMFYRQLDLKRFITAVFLIAAAITLSDQTASTLLKPFFERLRPCHDPDLQYLLHLPDGCGGQFGFASSHAANSFCLATLVFCFLRVQIKYSWMLFLWAIIIGWSRIYLGAHFMGDILAGYIIGFCCANMSFFLFRKWIKSGPIESAKAEST